MDITYLKKLGTKNKSKYNYLLCLVDHFSKYAQFYLFKNKETKEVVQNLRIYIKEIGTPKILQSDMKGNLKLK